MCGFVGIVNYKKDISNYKEILINMNNTLSKRGPDEDGYYISQNVGLGHKRLIVIDPKGGKQPMVEKYTYGEYVIVYNGQIYNTKELRKTLEENNFEFTGHCDTEILLKSYIHYGKDVVNHLNGIFAFAIWNTKEQELFMARDHFGVKPLFYTMYDNNFVFASEIKTLLKHPSIDSVVDKDGFLELISLGPARNLGDGIFRDIKEVPPANYLIFNDKGVTLKEYWELEVREHEDDLEKTKKYVRDLLVEIIENQLVSDVPVCTFLSGGLDSSIISKVAYDAFERNGQETLNTFSIDYKDNKKFFKKDYFQPNSDSDYVGKWLIF